MSPPRLQPTQDRTAASPNKREASTCRVGELTVAKYLPRTADENQAVDLAA